MDTESKEILNRLVIRWKQRTEEWETRFLESPLTSNETEQKKLDSLIEILGRHIEGLENISTTLLELKQFHTRLFNLQAVILNKPDKIQSFHNETEEQLNTDTSSFSSHDIENKSSKPKKEEDCLTTKKDNDNGTIMDSDIIHNINVELEVIETEMREMKCHNEEFLIRYMQMKDDYRTPIQALPLPYGFRCHKQYVVEVDVFKTRIQQLMKQAKIYQEKLRIFSTKKVHNETEKVEIQKITGDLNLCITTQQNLQASLYYFLMHMQPIDAEAFHMKCKDLIDRRLLCLEAKRMHQIRLLLISKK